MSLLKEESHTGLGRRVHNYIEKSNQSFDLIVVFKCLKQMIYALHCLLHFACNILLSSLKYSEQQFKNFIT